MVVSQVAHLTGHLAHPLTGQLVSQVADHLTETETQASKSKLS